MTTPISHLDTEAIAKKVFYFKLVIENMKLKDTELLTVAVALEIVGSELRQEAAELAKQKEEMGNG